MSKYYNLYKGFQKVFDAARSSSTPKNLRGNISTTIVGVKPNVPTTKLEKAKSKLAIAKQKAKTSALKLKNTLSDLKEKVTKREKKMALFNAIINTAAGIAKAIPNIPMMILAGVIGGMQIAAIKAQPIPMATGALAFSPTNALVGDNVNARNDPEIIAPLSKLQQYLSNQGSSVRVVGSISGNEIVLSSDKAHIGLARYA